MTIKKNVDEFNKFQNKLANWYSTSELIYLSIEILNKHFDLSFKFNAEDFSIDNKSEFSFGTFAKKNFSWLSSSILKSVELGYKLFGSIGYSRLAIIILSSYFGGMSLPAIFFRNQIQIGAMSGTFIFNWVIRYVTDYLDDFSSTCEYYKIYQVIDKSCFSLSNIIISSVDLLKLSIISSVEKTITI